MTASFLTLLCVFAYFCGCSAAVWTVSDPTLGIKPALNASVSGDTIRVLAGTYTGPQSCDLVIDKAGITLEAPDGPERTVVDCKSARSRCLSILGVGGVRVTGFSFLNGQAPGTPADQTRQAEKQEGAEEVCRGAVFNFSWILFS